MSTSTTRIEHILAEAVEIGGAPERQEFLQRACGEDAALREEVDRLLHNHFVAGSFLETPPSAIAKMGAGPTLDQPPSERPGTQIGPYKLLQQIGEGGMGVVYMAEQTEPIARRVALKVIKPGMDTHQVIARFEAERQALAVMDHPNIARVIDAGASESGRPYFVMELVRGTPITTYCDENSLNVRERLALFASVCQAIQHAHTKAIIHRDIKPTNALVALCDGVPVIKVIDFGVAKAIGQPLTEKTMCTSLGQIVGTIEYMSPEQAQFNQLDIDTRSDIYSLGVLLYELLTGTTPFDQSRFRTVAFDETLRIIREEEPPKPSTRLSACDTLPTIAANRGVEPARLRRLMRGELDWIVMKCLEKNRSRRYETASSLAGDIERYLHDEPVQACPPSAWYSLRKFVARNKTAVTIGALVLCFLLLVGGGIGWVVRDRAARLAERQREVQRTVAEAARLRDERRWAEARDAAKRLAWLLAGGAGQDKARLRAIEADLDMVARLEEIRLRPVVAEPYRPDTTGYADAARQTARDYAAAFRGYGIDIESLDSAYAAKYVSESTIREELIDALDEWIWLKHRFFGVTSTPRAAQQDGPRNKGIYDLRAILVLADPDTWRNQLRDPAVLGNRQALEALAAQPQAAALRPSTALLLSRALGVVDARDKGLEVLLAAQQRHPSDLPLNLELSTKLRAGKQTRWDEAIGFARAALAASPEHPGLHFHLGRLYSEAGYADLALAAFGRAQELGRDDASLHYHRGNVLARKGELVEAEAAYRKAIAGAPQLFNVRTELVSVLRKAGKWDEAVQVLEEVVEAAPQSHSTMTDVAWILATSPEAQRREFENAIDLSLQATQMEPTAPHAWESLAAAKYHLGDYAGAIAALDQGKRVRRGEPSAWYFLAMAHWQSGHQEQARIWYDRTVQWARDHQTSVRANQRLADELDRFGAEAEALIAPEKSRQRVAVELTKRARQDVAQGKWAEASEDYSQILQAKPDDLEIGFEYGAALLLSGDAVRYRELCARLSERGENLTCLNQPGRKENLLARICLLAPQSLADGDLPGRWAEQALAAEPGFTWYRHTVGLAQYRAGRYDDAEKQLELSLQSNPEWPGQPLNWLALALVHHHFGHAAKAQEWFDKAAEKIDKDRKQNPKALTGLRMHQHDWMSCLLLRRQAERLLMNVKGDNEAAEGSDRQSTTQNAAGIDPAAQ